MRYSNTSTRLASLGSDKWAVHLRAKEMIAAGHDVVIASIGEPEIPASGVLTNGIVKSLNDGRTAYSNGQGEANLLVAIANHYSRRRKQSISAKNVMCVPGTQTALFIAMAALVDHGDQVLVGDPYYATYDGLIAAQGGTLTPVPLSPENGFRMRASDIETRVTDATRAILLTTPHNPTGAVLTHDDIRAIGDVAKKHDLWIISDEVYEELVFNGDFTSPMEFDDLLERTVVVSSVSKSHAAPGVRSGWIIAPEEFVKKALPISETVLFGNQPFIADATAMALIEPNPTANIMRKNYKRRAAMLVNALRVVPNVEVAMPDAGMFAMVDIRPTGLTGDEFAWRLLENHNIAVMPGEAFGKQSAGFIRVGLTLSDQDMIRVIDGIKGLLQSLS
ncbi:aminotransferase [Amylibacter kogurei]|uniref:aspartate transaminase n=1 Tax=Paramylibacter kogurei TaxID=1889778 RepID=A0A2G5K928_9RHOB|nr:pyridoxal phosphate-dependent aminotransferase [Amylibacter kogurei]PIB25925.1 aminotransferase [Amylibacter kogurei]